MNKQDSIYCKSCAESILKQWKGWPHKDAVPLLPKSIGGKCEICSGNETVASTNIAWLNYHSEYSTGLPDYWLLVVNPHGNKWGFPYYAEGACPKCNNRTILSVMNYPNGLQEIRHNCQQCGVVKDG
jgi:hypothetical protein